MGNANVDKIFIRDLQCRCIVGINPEERVNKQDVIINVMMETDLRTPGRTDDINDTIDYKTVKLQILDLVEQSDFFLVERLADRIADICLNDTRVAAVEVTVDKPGALRYARSVAVCVRRVRADGNG